MSWSLVWCVALLAASACQAADLETFEVVHEWSRLDYDWPSAASRAAAIDSDDFIPDYCQLADVKVVDGVVFVTVPRLRGGVPSSINQLVSSGNATLLRPYPSWEMNAALKEAAADGSCHSIQYAHAIEIDPLKRMWMVDVGRYGMYGKGHSQCPPKLVIWDMVENREVRRHVFPEEVVDRSTSFLRGIVIDTASADPEDWFAYIASTGEEKLVVYSFREHSSWSIQHDSMQKDNSAVGITAGGFSGVFTVPIDSLALSPRTAKKQYLFYAALASFQFFRIATSLLRNQTVAESLTEQQLDAAIRDIGARSSQSEGMTISATGVMYYSVLNNNAINQYNTSKAFSALDQVYKDDEKLEWVDSFGWDAGYLYFTSNRMPKTSAFEFDNNDEILYRLMRANVGTDGYMGAQQQSRPISVASPAPLLVCSLSLLLTTLCASFSAAL